MMEPYLPLALALPGLSWGPGGPFGYCAPTRFPKLFFGVFDLATIPGSVSIRRCDYYFWPQSSFSFSKRSQEKLGPAFPTIRLMDPIGVERMGAFLIHIPPINYQFRFCAKLPSRSTAVGGPKNTFQQVIVFATAGLSWKQNKAENMIGDHNLCFFVFSERCLDYFSSFFFFISDLSLRSWSILGLAEKDEKIIFPLFTFSLAPV